ncbi:hypothetical protein CKSOR_00078 [Candidatus Kinetoplastibacterium sorsogonicusi]|uniref:AI-2E family transporter n=1 Tax=Candidatus Kinetoplastidibacterium kentomonadis TaxID=1576550 RepID=A0A3Q8ER85_9PROT|nr:AI-2E family transporter [Candidatus Kinetoplastibacterium sorsogonicusi]AWD32221.1 hypothetical protein CKSOR_00078 [Candidatus Kinetoplastibacterium sorsogonicusi]
MINPIIPSFFITRFSLLLIILAGLYFLHVFLIPILTALIIGFASWPIYKRLLYFFKNNNQIAASVILLLVILLIVMPICFALLYAVQEASVFIVWALESNKNGIAPPSWIISIPILGEKLEDIWNFYIGEPYAIGKLVKVISGENLGNIYRMIISATGNTFHLVLNILFMLIILFFVYKDGRSIVSQLDLIGELILQDRWYNLSRMVPATINATFTGMGLIALGEGVVLGFAYWLANVPSPVLLGVITCFMALIPGGAPISFTLVSLYLISTSNNFAGIMLFLWGTTELFIVDKTLRPRLVGGPVKLPFLPTFFGLVGGIKTMGIIGLFVGPVLMALLVSLWREWIKNIILNSTNKA